MTEKLYYRDAYKFEFDARVLECFQHSSHFGVILDRTYFYPEGGGQPADQGWLDDVPVIDVQVDGNNRIIHFTEKPLQIGPVHGKVNSDRRLDFMQQHTGQHILSQSLLRVGNYQTVSVHFGQNYTAVEIDQPRISEVDILDVEKLSNQIIQKNIPVKIYWVSPEEVSKFNIRKPPPNVDKIRIVEIQDFDYSTCGGIHVRHTGEVGLIKVVNTEKIRGRVRLHAKIGQRAFDDYHQKNVLMKELMRFLTCGEQDILSRIYDLQKQIKEKQKQVEYWQKQWVVTQAENALKSAEEINHVKIILKVFENLDNKMLKSFADHITKQSSSFVAAINQTQNGIYWIIAHSLSNGFDLKTIVTPLMDLIDAKGGGSSSLMQGGGKNLEGISRFLCELKQKVEQELVL